MAIESVIKQGIETGEVGRLERIESMGAQAIQREMSFNIEPKRAGAFALMTLLAMGFAGVSKAEAGTRFGPSIGQQVKRETTGQISRGVGEAMTGIDQSYYRKIEEAGREHSAKLSQLHDYETRLRNDLSARKITQQEYDLKKKQIEELKLKTEKEYHKKVAKIKAKQTIFQTVRRGVRGW